MKPNKNITTLQLPMILLLLIISLVPRPALAEQTLRFNTAFSYPLSTSEKTGFVDRVVQHALKSIGYDFNALTLPAERALRNANTGIDDGDLLRVAGLDKVYTNLIRVPEKIIDMEFYVFSKRRQLQVDSWEELKPYSIAIITGWKIIERNTNNVLERTSVRNVEQLFAMLAKGRVDAIVYSRWDGLGYIKKNSLKGIHILPSAIDKSPMYVYLHKKHRDLVPKLAKALKQMKLDGSYKKIFKQTLAPLLEN